MLYPQQTAPGRQSYLVWKLSSYESQGKLEVCAQVIRVAGKCHTGRLHLCDPWQHELLWEDGCLALQIRAFGNPLMLLWDKDALA